MQGLGFKTIWVSGSEFEYVALGIHRMLRFFATEGMDFLWALGAFGSRVWYHLGSEA